MNYHHQTEHQPWQPQLSPEQQLMMNTTHEQVEVDVPDNTHPERPQPKQQNLVDHVPTGVDRELFDLTKDELAQEFLIIPGVNRVEMLARFNEFVDVDALKKDPRGRSFLKLMQEIIDESIEIPGSALTPAMSRDGSTWTQAPQVGGRKLTASRPKMEDVEGKKLTGARALARIQSLVGLGGRIQIPLWSSGFWITIKSPSESQLIALDELVSREKIVLGRRTNGQVFSHMSVFVYKFIQDLVSELIVEHTVQDVGDLTRLISITDAHTIAWGLACSVWTSGFPLVRPVIDRKSTPGRYTERVVKERVDLGKLLHVDTSRLTEWQLSHMTRRASASMSLESLQRYQDEFTHNKGVRLDLGSQIAVELRVPTVQEYIESGYNWVDAIVRMTDQVFSVDADPKERNNYINKHGLATIMRQYSHWVASIDAGGGVIEGREDIDRGLEDMSRDDALRTAFLKGVTDYIASVVISVVGTTAVDECEEGAVPGFPQIVPLDPNTMFFTLVGQRITLILNR